VVVGRRTYLVDCGSGVTRQLRRARLLQHLHSVFLTHLHSDHDCDYFNLFLLGWPILQRKAPVDVYGPGRAASLPPLPPDAPPDRHGVLIHPANPTPGLLDMTTAQIEAHAYDLNIRMREAGRADLTALIVPHELDPGAGEGDPFVVCEDDGVRVTAALVDHAPVFPAFAFRFDTDDGSIVCSGDTAPCAGLIALARDADILVHEVYADDARAGDDDEDADWEARQRERHRTGAHTPLSAVGRIAAEAGATRLVLNHFLPGDDALPDEHWTRGVQDFDGEVIAGRDFLELSL
jgi:ribonuclease BN (tRNA processing enzyme)